MNRYGRLQEGGKKGGYAMHTERLQIKGKGEAGRGKEGEKKKSSLLGTLKITADWPELIGTLM